MVVEIQGYSKNIGVINQKPLFQRTQISDN